MSVTQSAHYIVDESGQMNDWKTWSLGNNNARMIGRRPEVVPGVEPGKWRVVRSRVSRYGLRWYVERRGCHGIVSFPTWREAMDYADRMARTREYVLPRVAPQGEVSVSATWYCGRASSARRTRRRETARPGVARPRRTGGTRVSTVAVSYTHLTLPTNREG